MRSKINGPLRRLRSANDFARADGHRRSSKRLPTTTEGSAGINETA